MGSGVQVATEAIYNILQMAGFTAELDFDTISGSGATSVLYTDLANGEFTALWRQERRNAYQFNISFDTKSLQAPSTRPISCTFPMPMLTLVRAYGCSC